MNAWHLDATATQLMIDAAILGATLLTATLLRRYVRLFQRYLIPNALIAGALGLLLGPELLRLVSFEVERMGMYVYHLLALTFICVGLKSRSDQQSRGGVHMGFMEVTCMLLQALLGLSIMLTFWALVSGDSSPAAGILLALGFAMGPGVAYSVGESWAAYGFEEAASVGLSLAALGFLAAYSVGVWAVNQSGRSTGNLPRSVRTGIRSREEQTVAGQLTLFPGALEPLTFHLALVAAVYGATYLATWALASGVDALGRPQEVSVVWAFHFLIANLVAIITRRLLDKSGASVTLDNGLLDRLTGVMADFLITASIMAISVAVAWSYALPIAIMTVVGTLATFLYLRFISRRLFTDLAFERFTGVFGTQTGTISSGLALIRILDPEYRSPVAQDLVLASAVAMGLAFPLLLAINIPFAGYDGRLEGYLILLAVLAGYLVVISVIWRLVWKREHKVSSKV